MQTQIVNFKGANLIAIIDENAVPFIAIKPICDAIGLDYVSAYKGLKNDEILSQLLSIRTTTGADFKRYEMVCVPIQMLSAWLFGIQIGKVNPEVRPALIEFKKECANALFQHFFGTTKNISENIKRQYEIRMEKKEVNKEINRLLSRHKQLEKELEELSTNNFKQLGLFFEEEKTLPSASSN